MDSGRTYGVPPLDEQKDPIQELKRLDARVMQHEHGKWSVEIDGSERRFNFVSGNDLKHLGKISGLAKLRLDNNFDDAAMEHVADLQSLEFLSVGNTRITQKGLGRLASLKNLQQLAIPRRLELPEDLKAALPNLRRHWKE